MTDPTNPDTNRPAPELGGITEYDVTLPFYRSIPGGGQEDMHISVRIPAADPEAAFQLGRRIAEHVGKNHTDPAGHLWSEVIPDITVTDATDTPAPAELAAELAHWRRVVAALATKAPGLLMLRPQEYLSADPDAIVTARVGDMMMFLPPAMPSPPAPDLTPDSPADLGPLADPDPTPAFFARLTLPVNPGGYADPDVRSVAPDALTAAKPGEVEVLVDSRWQRLDLATTDQGAVTLTTSGGLAVVDTGRMLTVRPATIEGYGTDLGKAAVAGRQMLTSTGWMTVDTADWIGEQAQSYKVALSNGNETRHTTIEAAEAVLLRQPRPGWWS